MVDNGSATLIDLSFHLSVTLIIVASHLPWGAVKKSQSRKVWKYSRANFELACALIDATDWDTILQGKGGGTGGASYSTPQYLLWGAFVAHYALPSAACKSFSPPNLILLPPPLLQGDCIDEIWDKWSNYCTLPKRRKLPWVNSSIRRAISRTNNYWERSRQNPSHREKYKQSCNKVLSMLREGKRNFPNSSPLKPKTFLENCEAPEWQDLNIHPSEQNYVQLTTDQGKANVLNTFFHSCFNTALPPLSCTVHVQNPAVLPSTAFVSTRKFLK